MTSKQGIVKQTTWWPLLLFSKYMRGWTVAAHVKSGSYTEETTPAWLQGVLEDGAPWLDVSAVVDEHGWVNVAVVNISDTRDWETTVKGVSGNKVEVHSVAGDEGQAVVGVAQSEWDGQGAFVFPKHSMTLLRWK